MKRIDNQTTVLLESPFKRHTFYAPKSVFRPRNLIFATIAIAIFGGIGVGAISIKFDGISKASAQTADTGASTPQGNVVVTTPQGLDGSQQKNLDEVKANEAAQQAEIEKRRKAALTTKAATMAQATTAAPSSTGPCVHGANLTPEQCKQVDDVLKSVSASTNDPKAKALADYVQADRDYHVAVKKADEAKAAIATATPDKRNAAIQDYKAAGDVAVAAGTKAKATRAAATAAGATPQELGAAISGASSTVTLVGAQGASQQGQQVASVSAPPAAPQVVYVPRPTPTGTTVIRAPRPTTDHVRCDRVMDRTAGTYTFMEIPENAPDSTTTGWCSAAMIGATAVIQVSR